MNKRRECIYNDKKKRIDTKNRYYPTLSTVQIVPSKIKVTKYLYLKI